MLTNLIPTLFVFLLQVFQVSYANEEIKMCYGSTSHNSIFKDLIPKFKVQTGITINRVSSLESGAVDHIRDVILGKCEGAIGNADRADLMKLVKKTGIEIEDAKITHRVIGREFLSILVNKANPISQLSSAQLKDIFSGKVKNWKEIGGSDLPISIAFAKSKTSTTSFFTKQVIGGEEMLSTALPLPDYPDVVDYVTKNVTAIAFIASAISEKETKVIKTESPIGRPKTLITIGKPSANMQKLIEVLMKTK